MSRLTARSIALAVGIATGCEVGHTPLPKTGEPPGNPSGAPVSVASSADTSALRVANVTRTGCDIIAQVLRNAAVSFGDQSNAVASARDTTGFLRDKSEAACVVEWRDSTAQALPLQDVYTLLERSGWRRRERLLYASGPGGEAVAFSRGGAACVVSGEADVGDDDDSTRVPTPGFIISSTCFGDRPDPPLVAEPLPTSLQIPGYMSSSALLGAGCGAYRPADVDTLISVIDVFVDSVTDKGLSELPLAVSFAPKSAAGLARRNMTAAIVYAVEGRPVPDKAVMGCPRSDGVILRLNASRILHATLTVDAPGPIQIEVRSMDRAALVAPILIEPGSVPDTVRWRPPRPAT